MRFEETLIGNVLVAKVLDSRIAADVVPRFKTQLIDYINSAYPSIVIDMSEVSFIDSSGLSALISGLKTVGEERNFVICGTRGSVASVFKLTRMDKVFRMYANAQEAVAALS